MGVGASDANPKLCYFPVDTPFSGSPRRVALAVTDTLFRENAYLRSCEATVIAAGPDALVLDQSVFYPLGGGQPGDQGILGRAGGQKFAIADTRKGKDGAIVHVPEAGAVLPAPGERVTLVLDWERRYAHMRMHTCLHLLGAVLPYGVTGGSITAQRSRLDFDMEETIDKEKVNRELNALIEADHPVATTWITDEELAAQPELIRTMSVKPPQDAGRVRLLEIPGVDLQPCGGTHVKRTGEIGPVKLGKVEKKGRHNRRVYVVFD